MKEFHVEVAGIGGVRPIRITTKSPVKIIDTTIDDAINYLVEQSGTQASLQLATKLTAIKELNKQVRTQTYAPVVISKEGKAESPGAVVEKLKRRIAKIEMELKNVKSVLYDKEPVPADIIVRQCASEYGVKVDWIKSRRRSRVVAWARQKAMYRIYLELNWSLPMVGRYFNVDHTTVLYAIKKLEKESKL